MKDCNNIYEAYQEVRPGVVQWVDDENPLENLGEITLHSDTPIDYINIKISILPHATFTPNFLFFDRVSATPQKLILYYSDTGLHLVQGKPCNRALVFASGDAKQLSIYLPPPDKDPKRFTNIVSGVFSQLIDNRSTHVLDMIDSPLVAKNILANIKANLPPSLDFYYVLCLWLKELVKQATKTASHLSEAYQEIRPGVVQWVDDDDAGEDFDFDSLIKLNLCFARLAVSLEPHNIGAIESVSTVWMYPQDIARTLSSDPKSGLASPFRLKNKELIKLGIITLAHVKSPDMCLVYIAPRVLDGWGDRPQFLNMLYSQLVRAVANSAEETVIGLKNTRALMERLASSSNWNYWLSIIATMQTSIGEGYQEIRPGIVGWVDDEDDESSALTEFWVCAVPYGITDKTIPSWVFLRAKSPGVGDVQIAVSDFVNRFNKSTGPRSVYVVNHMPLIFALPALSYSTQPHPKNIKGKIIMCIYK